MKKIIWGTILAGAVFIQAMPLKASARLTGKADTVKNTPAPQFTLKDIEGNTVSLSDYKGKVVVVDFWATWCVPCRESFPATQMTIDKYKDDKDVVFLFIDTREKTPDYQDLIKKFLADNKYTFHVLLDEKGDDGQQNKIYKTYVMPGIPTKYIIDRHGMIRYKNVGFVSELTKEEVSKDLSEEIESAKKG